MINNKPIITFAIPTWNRGDYLRESLDSIIEQILQQETAVEIFVSDNASSDSTNNILRQYSMKYGFFRYSINSANVGFDLNLINAISHSEGVYIWTFSDDDLLQKDALNKMIELIKNFSPNYICPIFDQFTLKNGELKKLQLENYFKKFNKIKNDIQGLDFQKIIQFQLDRSGYLSINIFKRSTLKLEDIKSNIDKVKAWSHLWMLAQATISGGGIISSYSAVSQRIDNSSTNISVFLKQLPDAFEFIFYQFKIDKSFQKMFFKKLSDEIFSFRGLIYITILLKLKYSKMDLAQINGKILKLSASLYFKVIFPIIPRFLLVLLTKIVRWKKGIGFNLAGKTLEKKF